MNFIRELSGNLFPSCLIEEFTSQRALLQHWLEAIFQVFLSVESPIQRYTPTQGEPEPFYASYKEEGYNHQAPINIKMPRVEQKKMRVLSPEELAVEFEQKLPWVEKVVTKWAISGTSARNLTPKAAQAKIRSAAKASLKNLESKEIFALPSPIRFEVDFKSPR
ncbi:MAG: M55 family metallopeptidase [Chloroflexota bacterium]|nr:M55 family metallopeptidase [Chloroflexota bacterium]